MIEDIESANPTPAQLLFVNDGNVWILEGHGAQFDDNIEVIFAQAGGRKTLGIPLLQLFDFLAAMRILPKGDYVQFLKDNA